MDERGNVVGVDYTTAGGECHLDAVPTPLGANPTFRTTSAVRFYKVAPQLDPDAPTDVRGHGGPGDPNEKARRGPDGKKKPPESFVQKYWMYLLPGMFILSNMLAGPEPPPKAAAKKR